MSANFQLEAFDSLYDLLTRSLAAEDIIPVCYSKGLIPLYGLEAAQAAAVPSDKAAILLKCIRKSLESDPAAFEKFLKILSEEQANDHIVQQLRDKVKELTTTTVPPSLRATPTTDVPLGVRRYAEYLRSVYDIKPCGDQWSLVVSKCYINLSTVERIEDFPKEKEEICTLAMIHAKVEEVKKLKRSIEIGQVGLLGNGQRARCIIVEGIPGIGKSTFSWHLGVCWAQKEILHGYHLVVLLRLRDERVQRAKCVSDLFYHHDQTTQQSVVQWITSIEGDGVMMVLDGYDELSSHLQTSSIFADIIKGEVLPKMTVLVSTRPSANQNLHQLCHSQKCQFIEVIGFGLEEIQQYVDGALEHNKELRDQLKSYLEHHPHIHGLMYVPLNCAIVVRVFRDQMRNKSQPPQTHTEVYQLLVKTVLKRHEEKPPAAKRPRKTCTILSKPSRYSWLGDVSEETISQLLVLAKLAYEGTKEDQLIFHGIGGALETLGLLQEVPELFLESSGSSSYHFIHKTVQEFMAALYVSSLPPGERAEFVRTSFGKSNMTMVMRFMAGLTKFESQDDIQSISAFQEEGGTRLVESLHWLFEAHDPDLIQKCIGEGEWELKHVWIRLDPLECFVFGYCIANSRQLWSLQLYDCFNHAECMKMLTVVEKGRAFDYIKSIDFFNDVELGDQGAIILGTMLRENNVLTSLRLRDCGLGPEGLSEVCSAVEMNTTLTSLDLSCNKFKGQRVSSLGTMLRKNKVLTSLTLELCELGPHGVSDVCNAVGMNTTLTSLDLSENKFDDQSIASLVTMLTKNKILSSLGLRSCGLVGLYASVCPDYCHKVCNAVGINTTLTSLDLSGNLFGLKTKTIDSLGTMLRKNKVLTSLRLVDCGLHVDPVGLCKVLSAVGMNATLISLDLSETKFDDQSIASLGTMLRENKVLTSLRLRTCELHVGPKGLSDVCSIVKMNTTLTSLNLSWNTFDNQNIPHLGSMIRENNVLTSLELVHCELDSDGLCEVCSAVGLNTTLTSLDLSGNMFNDQSIASLVHLLANNQTLEDLQMRDCGLDDACICSLAKGIKHCKLKKLDLRDNDFVTREVTELRHVLKDHPTLVIEMPTYQSLSRVSSKRIR